MYLDLKVLKPYQFLWYKKISIVVTIDKRTYLKMWLLWYIHKVTKTCFGRFCWASMIAWQFANYQQKKNAFLLHTILFYCLELGLDTFYCPALLHHYIIGSMPLDIVVFVVFFWNRRSLSQPQITTVRQIMDQVERERE